MTEQLFIYGTLAPGQSNHHVIAHFPGTWQPANVTGRLYPEGYGATIGYPAIVLIDDGDEIEGHLFISEALSQHWQMLDEFEGDGYIRVPTQVTLTDGKTTEAFIYALR